jgi:hypothetical protein
MLFNDSVADEALRDEAHVHRLRRRPVPLSADGTIVRMDFADERVHHLHLLGCDVDGCTSFCY